MMYGNNWSSLMLGSWMGGFGAVAGVLLLPLVIWSLVWKGWALWRAAKNDSKVWFIVLLVVNTFGILEILYIFWFSKMKRMAPERSASRSKSRSRSRK